MLLMSRMPRSCTRPKVTARMPTPARRGGAGRPLPPWQSIGRWGCARLRRKAGCGTAARRCRSGWRSWPAGRLPFRRCTGRPQRPAPRPWCCRPRTARKGQAQRPGRIARGRALGLQVSGQQEAYVLFGGVGFFRQSRAVCNCSCVSAASQLACPEAVVTVQLIELCRQRAFALLLPPMQACAAMTGGFGKIRVSPRRVAMKNPLSGLFFFGICAIIALVRYSAPSALPGNCNFASRQAYCRQSGQPPSSQSTPP